MTNNIIEKYKKILQKQDFEFLKRIYSNDIKVYEKRILQYEFTNFENVLDAGCGFGQWSIPLAKHNTNVYSIDISKERVSFTEELAQELNIKNLTTSLQSINNTNFKDNSFDAIFCYGVFFLTDWKKTLQEFKRLLKPKAKLYLNANGMGWYLNLLINEHNKTSSYNPRKYALDCIINTERYINNKSLYQEGLDVIIEKNELLDALKLYDFFDIVVADEGKLNSQEAHNFFKGTYHGQTGVYELTALKDKSN